MAPPNRLDSTGRRIRSGDIVRVLGVPDLSGLSRSARRESAPVFEHIVGRYKRVQGFNRLGHAELSFRILRGACAGFHTVWLEPSLLRVRRPA